MISRTSHSLDRDSDWASSRTCPSSDTRYYSEDDCVKRIHQTSHFSTDCDSAFSNISSTDDEAGSNTKPVQLFSDSSLRKHLEKPLTRSNASHHRPKTFLSEDGLCEKRGVKEERIYQESKQSQASSVEVKSKKHIRGKLHLPPETTRRTSSPVKSESGSSRTEESLAFTSHDSDTHVQSNLRRRSPKPVSHHFHAKDASVNNSTPKLRSTLRPRRNRTLSSSNQLSTKNKKRFDNIFQSREIIKTEIHGQHHNKMVVANNNNCAKDNIYIDPIYRPIYAGLEKSIPAVTQSKDVHEGEECVLQSKLAITKSSGNKCKESLKQELVKSLYKQYRDDMKRLGDKSKVTQFVIEAPGLRGKFVNGSGHQGIIIADPLSIPNNKTSLQTKKFVRRQSKILKSEMKMKRRKKSQLSTASDGVYHRSLAPETQETHVNAGVQRTVEESTNRKIVIKPRASSRSRTREADNEPRDTCQEASQNSARASVAQEGKPRATVRNTSAERKVNGRSASCSPTRKTETNRSRSRPRTSTSPCRQNVNRKPSQGDVNTSVQHGRSASGSRKTNGQTMERSKVNRSSRQRNASPNKRINGTKNLENREGNIHQQRGTPASDPRKTTGRTLMTPPNEGTVCRNTHALSNEHTNKRKVIQKSTTNKSVQGRSVTDESLKTRRMESNDRHAHGQAKNEEMKNETSVERRAQKECNSPAKQQSPIHHKQSANREDLQHFVGGKEQGKEINGWSAHNECHGPAKPKSPVRHQPIANREELQHVDGRKQQDKCIASTKSVQRKSSDPSTQNSKIGHKHSANSEESRHLDRRTQQEKAMPVERSAHKEHNGAAKRNGQIGHTQSVDGEDALYPDSRKHDEALAEGKSTGHDLNRRSKRKVTVSHHQSSQIEQLQYFDGTEQQDKEITAQKRSKNGRNISTKHTIRSEPKHIHRDMSSDDQTGGHTVRVHVSKVSQTVHYKENDLNDHEIYESRICDSLNESVSYTPEDQVRLISDSQHLFTETVHEHTNASVLQNTYISELQNDTLVFNPSEREILSIDPQNDTFVFNPVENRPIMFDKKNVFPEMVDEDDYDDAMMQEQFISELQNAIKELRPTEQERINAHTLSAFPETVYENFVEEPTVQERHMPEMQNGNVAFGPIEQEITAYDNQHGFEEALYENDVGDTFENQTMHESHTKSKVYGAKVQRKINGNSETIFWDTLYDTDIYNEVDQEIASPNYQNDGIGVDELEQGKIPCEPQCAFLEAFNEANAHCSTVREMYIPEKQNNPLLYTFTDRTRTPPKPQNIFWEKLYETDVDGSAHQEVQGSVLQTKPLLQTPEEQREIGFNEVQNAFGEQMGVNQDNLPGETEGFSYVLQNDPNACNTDDHIRQQNESQNIRWEELDGSYVNSSPVSEMSISNFHYKSVCNVDERDGAIGESQEVFWDAQNTSVENCPVEPEMSVQYKHVYNLERKEKSVSKSQPRVREATSENNTHVHLQENRPISKQTNEAFVNSAVKDTGINSASPNVSNNIMSDNNVNGRVEHVSPMLQPQTKHRMVPQTINNIVFVRPIKTISEPDQANLKKHQPYIKSRLQRVAPISYKQNNFRTTLEEPNSICDFQEERPQSSMQHPLNNVYPSSNMMKQEHHWNGMSLPNPFYTMPLDEPYIMQPSPSVIPQQVLYTNTLHKPNMFCEMQKENTMHRNTFQEPYLFEQVQPKYKNVFPGNAYKQMLQNPTLIAKIQKERSEPIQYQSRTSNNGTTEPNIIPTHCTFRETVPATNGVGEMNRAIQIAQPQCLRSTLQAPTIISQKQQSNTYSQNSLSQSLATPRMVGHAQKGSSVIYLQNTVHGDRFCQQQNTHQDTFQKSNTFGNVQSQIREEQYPQNICRTASQDKNKMGETHQGAQNAHPSTTFRKQLQEPNRVGHFQQATQTSQAENGYSRILEESSGVDQFEQENQRFQNQKPHTTLHESNEFVQFDQGNQNMSPELQTPMLFGQLEQDGQRPLARIVHSSRPLQEPIQDSQVQHGRQNVHHNRKNAQEQNQVGQFTHGNQMRLEPHANRNALREPNINAQEPQRRQSPNNQNLSGNTIQDHSVISHHQRYNSVAQHKHADQKLAQIPIVTGGEQQGRDNHCLKNNYRQTSNDQSVTNQLNRRKLPSQTRYSLQTTSQEQNVIGQTIQGNHACLSLNTDRNRLREPNVAGHIQQTNQNIHRTPPQVSMIVGQVKQENQRHSRQHIHGDTSHQPNIADHARQRHHTRTHENTHGNTFQGSTLVGQVQHEHQTHCAQGTHANTSHESKVTDHSQQRYHHRTPQDNYEQILQGPTIIGQIQEETQRHRPQKTYISQNTTGHTQQQTSHQDTYRRPLQEPNSVIGQEQHGRRDCRSQHNNVERVQRSDGVSKVTQSNQNPCGQTNYRNASQKQFVTVQEHQGTRAYLPQNTCQGTPQGPDITRHRQQENPPQNTFRNASLLPVQNNQRPQSTPRHHTQNIHGNKLKQQTIFESAEQRRQIPSNQNYYKNSTNEQRQQPESLSQPQNACRRRSTHEPNTQQRRQIARTQSPYRGTVEETTTIITQKHQQAPTVQTQKSIIETVQCSNNAFERQHQILLCDSHDLLKQMLPQPYVVTKVQRRTVFPAVCARTLQKATEEFSRQRASLESNSRNLDNSLKEQQVVSEMQRGSVVPHRQATTSRRMSQETNNNLSRQEAILASSSHSFYKKVQATQINGNNFQ